MNKLLLTPEEAGDLIGVGRARVYELLRRGAIESARIGRSRRSRTRLSSPMSSASARRRRATRSPAHYDRTGAAPAWLRDGVLRRIPRVLGRPAPA